MDSAATHNSVLIHAAHAFMVCINWHGVVMTGHVYTCDTPTHSFLRQSNYLW